MLNTTDDLRIRELKTLATPAQVIAEVPRTEAASAAVTGARVALHDILTGADDRLAVVIGPCSIHDPKAAMDYAARLAKARARHLGELEVIMRVYFEKPRTTVGWKGLINDPGLDGSFRIDEGLRLARRLLVDINGLGLPAGCEFLDVDHAAVLRRPGGLGRDRRAHHRKPDPPRTGVRPVLPDRLQERHRRQCPHRGRRHQGRVPSAPFPGGDQGRALGDRLDHRQRGLPPRSCAAAAAPNYDAASVEAACRQLERRGPAAAGDDRRQPRQQRQGPGQPARVVDDVAGQVAAGDRRIIGVMVESHLVGGRQDLVPGQPLVYGQSITDGCIDWDTSEAVLERLAEAVKVRRQRAAKAAPAAMAGAAG